MSRLKDLSNDKVTIMERVISNQNLCKAIYYNQSNFLDQPDMDDTSILVYEHIHPYRKVPDVSTENKTHVTMSFNRYRKVGNAFKSGIIYLHVLVHKDNIKTDYGYLRTDYIVSEIDELINQGRGLGIGKAEFYEMDDIFVNNNYLGITIGYKVYEFN